MPELFAGHILAFVAHEGDDHTDMRDRHFKHVDHFDRGEARVDEITAREQDLLLQSLGAVIVNEGLGILEQVVSIDRQSGDLALRQGSAFARRDNTDLVVRDVDHGRQLHAEQQRIYPVCAGTHQRHLRTTLTAIGQKGAGVLERVAGNPAGNDPAGRQRLAVTRFHAAHLARRNSQEFHQVNPVLQRPQAEMQARCQRVGLVAGLAIQGNDAAVRQFAVFAEGKLLGHDADAVVGNHDDATQPEYGPVGGYQENEAQQQDQAGMCVPKSINQVSMLVSCWF